MPDFDGICYFRFGPQRTAGKRAANGCNQSPADRQRPSVAGGNAARAAIISSWIDVGLAKRLRPDQAVLAVMDVSTRRFDESIQTASNALAVVGIKFEVLTPSTYEVEDDPYLIGT